MVTYFISLRHMSPSKVQGMLREVSLISVLTWLVLISLVFIGNTIRMNLWVLRKYGYIKEKEVAVPNAEIDDDQEVSGR